MKILFKTPAFENSDKGAEFIEATLRITAYKGIETMGSHYLLEMDNNEVTIETIRQLFLLFDAWDIDKSPLESFVQYIEAESETSNSTIN